MTSKSDFKVKRHLAICNAQGPQFIIPSRYVTIKITSKVSLNDTSSCPPPNRQPTCSHIISKLGQSISRKRIIVLDIDRNTTMAESETKKKLRSLWERNR